MPHGLFDTQSVETQGVARFAVVGVTHQVGVQDNEGGVGADLVVDLATMLDNSVDECLARKAVVRLGQDAMYSDSQRPIRSPMWRVQPVHPRSVG